ncbi:MAG TPA: methyltransferase domain-containing protein [Thermomicrobiales bacterium]|nr:methyltransferase domain-containing protein [Thermomicrobiales bacterium]
MSDVWSMVPELDDAVQERMAAVLETRGADPQQQAMRRVFLSDIAFPDGARVLDVGCGTGVLTRVIAGWPGVAEVVGVDPAPSLLEKARGLAAGLTNLTFEVADGRELPYEDDSFDVVIFDSTLCHVPHPERALAEAFRVLRPSGWLAAFDGDYATTTVALGDHDPLQACADVTMANSVNDRWLVRRLPALARACGYEVVGFRSHGFTETTEGGYMLTVVERGADMLHAFGQISGETAAMLKAEAYRRVEGKTFFGHIAYGSLTARKPGA